MKYFLDTEFIEGTQHTFFGKTKPTIDLISIGIVAEDGREYYAISKEFNLKEAWDRYQLNEKKDYENYSLKDRGKILYNKEYWLRDNVLKPICKELAEKDGIFAHGEDSYFTYNVCKRLINKYGKTNKQIANDILYFTRSTEIDHPTKCQCSERVTCYECQAVDNYNNNLDDNIQFYGYYSDYDWVVFCWLFGKMIDLPKGFPMYCIDLKQTLDEKNIGDVSLKDLPDYPKQTNEHNALADARWNYELYKFLNTL